MVFFEFLLMLGDIEKIRKIFFISSKLKDNILEILKRFLLVFSVIKNNIFFYLFDIDFIVDELDEVYELFF